LYLQGFLEFHTLALCIKATAIKLCFFQFVLLTCFLAKTP
jgi:hypothetical protein